jgi:hypothetical protein
MEGAPNDGTSADPAMTPIERQMQVIATSIQDLARETSRQNQELWQAIRKGPPTPMTTTNLLRGVETGQMTRKLTATKSPVVGEAKLRELRPAAGTERKAQQVPLHLANIRQLKQPERPERSSKQPEREIDGKTPPVNLIIQTDPREIRRTKRHIWRKSCEK